MIFYSALLCLRLPCVEYFFMNDLEIWFRWYGGLGLSGKLHNELGSHQMKEKRTVADHHLYNTGTF